jgi:hypothetical protein
VSEVRYEYRPVKRVKGTDEWKQIYTGGGRSAYGTKGAAKGVLTRERREDEDRRTWWFRNDPLPEWEYGIQRRPFGDWEDFQ